MIAQNKVLIISPDVLSGLGLKTLLAERFGLSASFATSLEELALSEIRMKEFRIIFCDAQSSESLSVLMRRVFRDRLVVFSSKSYHTTTFPFLHTSVSFDELLTRMSEVISGKLDLTDERSHQLSPREIEVLKLLAQGYITKQIGDKLGISFHTVISHRKNISAKLGIKTVSGLTVYATINGYISPEKIL